LLGNQPASIGGKNTGKPADESGAPELRELSSHSRSLRRPPLCWARWAITTGMDPLASAQTPDAQASRDGHLGDPGIW